MKHLWAMVLAGCLLTGCVRPSATTPDTSTAQTLSDRQMLERFPKVEKGMASEQVVALLGEPKNGEASRLRFVVYDGPHHGWSLEAWLQGGVVTNVTQRHWMEYPERK
jgi:hypothetical protein